MISTISIIFFTALLDGSRGSILRALVLLYATLGTFWLLLLWPYDKALRVLVFPIEMTGEKMKVTRD